jgi:hypothetical protein
MAGDFDYERHGHGYADQRRTDPVIAGRVHAALGAARTVLNVGAGTGSYEPDDRYVLAVEPSPAMRSQRPAHRVPAINAVAQNLPFDDRSVDASMALLTVHQWGTFELGLRELRRVTRGPVVILTFDADALDQFWLGDYVPDLIAFAQKRYPAIDIIRACLGGASTIEAVPIPHNCLDGFAESYYGRPERFLEHAVRQAQSAWGFVTEADREKAVIKLRDDLQSGTWDENYGKLRELPQYEGALRLIVARPE